MTGVQTCALPIYTFNINIERKMTRPSPDQSNIFTPIFYARNHWWVIFLINVYKKNVVLTLSKQTFRIGDMDLIESHQWYTLNFNHSMCRESRDTYKTRLEKGFNR